MQTRVEPNPRRAANDLTSTVLKVIDRRIRYVHVTRNCRPVEEKKMG